MVSGCNGGCYRITSAADVLRHDGHPVHKSSLLDRLIPVKGGHGGGRCCTATIVIGWWYNGHRTAGCRRSRRRAVGAGRRKG